MIFYGYILIKFDKYIKIILLVYKMDYEITQMFSETIVIKSNELLRTKNIDGYVLNHLKKNENKCHNNGYIIPDSTKLVQRSIGKISSINNQNFIEYNVNYQCKIIIPATDDIFNGKVDNITHMGIVAYLDYKSTESIKESPILFIIPKQFVEDKLIETLNKGDEIKIKVIDTRIKFQSNQIQVIGEYLP